jgi:hypothetical protein
VVVDEISHEGLRARLHDKGVSGRQASRRHRCRAEGPHRNDQLDQP